MKDQSRTSQTTTFSEWLAELKADAARCGWGNYVEDPEAYRNVWISGQSPKETLDDESTYQ
jgi:hypothetical protein